MMGWDPKTGVPVRFLACFDRSIGTCAEYLVQWRRESAWPVVFFHRAQILWEVLVVRIISGLYRP